MSYADMVAEMFDEPVYQLDGFDDCIIGYTPGAKLVYSIPKILDQLRERDGLARDDAYEHFSFNILGTVEGADLGCVMVWER